MFDRCSQLAIRSIYIANQVVHPGPVYLRDVIVELARPPAVNDVVYKLFCLDAGHVRLNEQTMIDRLACAAAGEGAERRFQVVAGGREELSVSCGGLKFEVHGER